MFVFSVLTVGIAVDPDRISLHGATIEEGRSGKAIRLTSKGWAQYLLPEKLNTRQGSISLWIKPLWSEADKKSQTFLSLTWDDGRNGYLALSQGWWEPAGEQRLYFVLNNQDYVYCSAPYKLVPGFWTQITVTWKNGTNGGCRIYIDGKKVAEISKYYYTSYTSAGSIILGSDRGTTEKKGRGAEALIDDLMFSDHSLSEEEVKTAFQLQRKDSDLLEHKKWKWLWDGLELPLKSERTIHGTLKETRVVFDEDIRWATSRDETDKILSRINRAGFNVYVPCVWHGKSAYFASLVAHPDSQLNHRIDAGDDPLAYLIKKAHSLGIEIHPWFTVAQRSTDEFANFYNRGTPENAFDVHNREFRSFITALMLDVVRRYQVEGINLDYIRAMGICTSESCRADYEKDSGYEFWPDYALRGVNSKARDRLQKWQDKAVSDIVVSFSKAAKALKPELIISVDGHPQPREAIRPLEGKDEILWANNGWIDEIFAMDYNERIAFETIDKVRDDLQNPNRLMVLFGNYDKRDTTVAARPGKLVDNYAEYARRKWPGSGVAFYLYGQLSDEQVETLAKGAFAEKSLPAWRHAERENTGL